MDNKLETAIRELLKSVLVDVLREVPPRPASSPDSNSDNYRRAAVLLRPKKAAKVLAVSERTLFELTRTGQIPSLRIGRLVRYSVDALGEWIRHAGNEPRRAKTKTEPLAGVKASSEPSNRLVRRPREPKHASAEPVARRVPSSIPPPLGKRSAKTPRTVLSQFAERLGVSMEALPKMTNGDLKRIAQVDIATLHGWQYHNRELPEVAITRLHEFFTAHVAAASQDGD